MKLRAAFMTVSPYLGAFGVVVLIAMLLGTIYYTWLEVRWVPFLAGILVASILALVGRASRAEWALLRRTAQLSSVREKLAKETLLRARAEEALAFVKTNVHYLDQEMPAMLAYVDAEQRYRYHNRAFRVFRGVKSENIDGRHLREVLGAATYSEIEDSAKQALSGCTVRFEHTQRAAGNTVFRLSTQFLPHFGAEGEVLGFYAVQTDITAAKDLLVAMPPLTLGEAEPTHAQKAHVNMVEGELADGYDPAGRIRAALDNDEFCLYCHSIVPTASVSAELPFHELLIRLKEEEQNLILPGSFLPLAEEHGMLPALDRWVVRHLLHWASNTPGHQKAIYSINISGTTISDPDFPQFVREQLRSHPVPGTQICFELAEIEALARQAEVANLIRQLKPEGCLFALCGIGRTPVPVDLLKRMRVDYLKISGDIILNILRDPADLAKLTAINRLAHTMRIGTVAEFVESEQTLAKLRELKVDFAQGFGISRPRPIDELTNRIPAQPRAQNA